MQVVAERMVYLQKADEELKIIDTHTCNHLGHAVF